MAKEDKRPRDHHRHSPPHHHRRRHRSSSSRSPCRRDHHQSPPKNKRPVFASYLDEPTLPAKLKLLCEIVAKAPASSVEQVLDDTDVRVSSPEVEQVLKLSYSNPRSAVKFFRWSGRQLNDHHSPYAWNLVVDLLGKNSLFDAMWDAVKSMLEERIISLVTFASVFSSYVAAGCLRDAIMVFDIMDQYGVPQDVVALNSLLSAICRDGCTADATEFLRSAKGRIKPDLDTYAILLEGSENERNVAQAKEIFSDMVLAIGWDPGNVPAYDSFLCTLLKSSCGFSEAIQYLERLKDKRCYPGVKFFNVAIEDCLRNSDVKGAELIWEIMVGRIGFVPDLQMHNSMISLYCYSNNTEKAIKFLDEMVYIGVFPDAQTYNLFFKFLVKNRRIREAKALFNEMVKNECFPSNANCGAAIKAFMHSGDPYSAIKVWKFMRENHDSDLEEIGNFLVVGLRDMNLLPEAVKYAEGMVEKGIKLSSSSLSKLKQCLTKSGKEIVYEDLLRKWKA